MRVDAVIFELNEASMSNFDKLKFFSMTLKIQRLFEKRKEKINQKWAKRAMNLVSKKNHNKCKISYMRENIIFL